MVKGYSFSTGRGGRGGGKDAVPYDVPDPRAEAHPPLSCRPAAFKLVLLPYLGKNPQSSSGSYCSNQLKLITFDFSSKLRFRISICLDRDYSCTIFFLYGRIGSRFDSWAFPQSGVNTVQADYRGSHILMNNGSWVDFSKSVCYSTIYTHVLLIMTMSLKFLSDN